MNTIMIKDLFAVIGMLFLFCRVCLLLLPFDNECQLRECLKFKILRCVSAFVGIDTTQGLKRMTEAGTKQLIVKLSRRLKKKQLLSQDELYLLNLFQNQLKKLWRK